MAMGWSDDELLDHLLDGSVGDDPLGDFALPIVALTRGRKVDSKIQEHFGNATLEELWLPYFCISANLTTGRDHVHLRGPLGVALRASVAIPGLVPPVLAPEGILVDGAVLNNLPVDVMAGFERGLVWAVDVADDTALEPSRPPVRGWPERWARALLGIDARLPSIAHTLLRAAMVSSDAQRSLSASRAHAFIRPDLSGIDLRGWREYQRAIDVGYQHTRCLIDRGELPLPL
jgi:NTE family protein